VQVITFHRIDSGLGTNGKSLGRFNPEMDDQNDTKRRLYAGGFRNDIDDFDSLIEPMLGMEKEFRPGRTCVLQHRLPHGVVSEVL
jgi:hypothetical protein